MIELGFYLSLLLSVASDVKRKVSDTACCAACCKKNPLEIFHQDRSLAKCLKRWECVWAAVCVFWGFRHWFLHLVWCWVDLLGFRRLLKISVLSLVDASSDSLRVNVWLELCGKSQIDHLIFGSKGCCENPAWFYNNIFLEFSWTTPCWNQTFVL